MPVPNSFANVTTSIPLSQLDANFNTPITLGNTAIQLGNTVSTLNNMTLANVTVSSGNVTITNVSVTTANVTTINTSSLIVTSTGTFAAGSNTAPSITFTGDTNTGIYSPAADTIAFTEGGVESMRINSSGQVGIGTTSPSYPLHVSSSGNNTKARFTNGTTTLDLYCGGTEVYTGTANSATAWAFDNSNTYIAGFVNSSEKIRITTGGDLQITNGNVVIGTAGKGIDFSATPGTGTSELLADYEDGTWTPTLVAATTNFTSVTYGAQTGGKYTKIGNRVFLTGTIVTDAVTKGSAAGDIIVQGLPFTPAASTGGTQNGFESGAIGESSLWLVNQPSSIRLEGGTSNLVLAYRATSAGNNVRLTPADVDTGSTKNVLRFFVSYAT